MPEAVLQLHQLIARALVLYFALLGLWGIYLAIRKRPLDSGFQGSLTIGVILGVVQAIVGGVLLLSGLRPRDDLHFLYGLSVIVAIPLAQQYLTNRKFSKVLGMALASLFVMGLAIRAITTGS